MVQIDFGALAVAFIAAMGIPSAIMGLLTWHLKKRIEAAEEEQAQKNRDRKSVV